MHPLLVAVERGPVSEILATVWDWAAHPLFGRFGWSGGEQMIADGCSHRSYGHRQGGSWTGSNYRLGDGRYKISGFEAWDLSARWIVGKLTLERGR